MDRTHLPTFTISPTLGKIQKELCLAAGTPPRGETTSRPAFPAQPPSPKGGGYQNGVQPPQPKAGKFFLKGFLYTMRFSFLAQPSRARVL